MSNSGSYTENLSLSSRTREAYDKIGYNREVGGTQGFVMAYGRKRPLKNLEGYAIEIYYSV